MAVTAHDVRTLQTYAAGVMGRADHHAGQVKAIALALLGGIIWRAEPGSIDIKQYDGELANVLWFVVNGKRYAVAYNHHTLRIEIRDRTQSGPAIHAFDNQTPVTSVEAIFTTL
ncbi:hypothetical protein [Sphingomonas oligoaromativorans]|uniref:hypothetical protein n=1 Tax=Sphingomonas oligoaromativorans TaxID=575322 RepID=UPI001421EED4|nr:hypothetical protein [Sphingomonas oligoaromativorans]NIJ35320.1 hypothetical protein [Sphingomonas oligoaromativorans]